MFTSASPPASSNSLSREIGRVEKFCGIEATAALSAPPATQAQAPAPSAETDALRRGVVQGAAICKANLASAPADLKLGEVEEFCTCMGVHEFAMSEMTNEAKASLRPRQQQMCVEIVRKQGTAPAPATTPAAPPSPPPAPSVAAEQPAANAPAPAAAQPMARRPGAFPFEGTWRLRAEEACGSNMGMTITKDAIYQGAAGTLSVSKIIAVKRRNEMTYSLTIQEPDKQRSGRTTVHIGMENGDAITGDGPIFDGHSVEYLRCPDRLPAGATAVAPSTPAREPKPAPRCNISEAQIRADWNRLDQQLRARVNAEFMQTGALSKSTACQDMRRLNAFHQATIKKSNACEGAASRSGIIGELRAQITKNNAAIRRNNWCG